MLPRALATLGHEAGRRLDLEGATILADTAQHPKPHHGRGASAAQRLQLFHRPSIASAVQQQARYGGRIRSDQHRRRPHRWKKPSYQHFSRGGSVDGDGDHTLFTVRLIATRQQLDNHEQIRSRAARYATCDGLRVFGHVLFTPPNLTA